MFPEKSNPRWKALLMGEFHHQFKLVAAGLCVSRIQRSLTRDKSQAALNTATEEVYSFFKKYETVLVDDIKAIFG